jgi:hypothetical protein
MPKQNQLFTDKQSLLCLQSKFYQTTIIVLNYIKIIEIYSLYATFQSSTVEI